MKNTFCQTIGIQYPIILGGMARVGTASLAAAVSNAGGLGLLGASTWDPSELRNQICQTREMTNKVFGVNIPVRSRHSEEIVRTVIEEKITVVSTSAGDPRVYTARLKENGIFVMHVVPTVEFAVKAEAAGVDAVIAEGVEAGGVTSPDEVTTFILVPRVVDAVSCPVIAAGGIGDGRGLAAALALGAVAVQMGTVFLATNECEASPAFKEALVMAKETDTVLRRGEKGSVRMISESFYNEAKKRYDQHLPEDAGTQKPFKGISTRGCGQVAGLIRRIRPAADLIEEMVKDANKTLPVIQTHLGV